MEDEHKEEKPSILDKVLLSRQTTMKKKYGTSELKMSVLEKIVPKEDLAVLVERYNKNVDLASAWGRRIKKPKPANIQLFQEHLSYPGTLSDFARSKNMLLPVLMHKIHTVAYYEYVIERKQLPIPKTKF